MQNGLISAVSKCRSFLYQSALCARSFLSCRYLFHDGTECVGGRSCTGPFPPAFMPPHSRCPSCVLLGVISQDSVLPSRREASPSPVVQQGWVRTIKGFCPNVSPELARPSCLPAVGAGIWCSALYKAQTSFDTMTFLDKSGATVQGLRVSRQDRPSEAHNLEP